MANSIYSSLLSTPTSLNCCCNPYVEEKLIRGLPLCPCFVVINTTPFDPRDPYIADDAASLRISRDSISFGLIVSRPPEIGKPSTTYRGELELVMELTPRILIDIPAPGLPDTSCT